MELIEREEEEEEKWNHVENSRDKFISTLLQEKHWFGTDKNEVRMKVQEL